jgi:hypothetical protein
MAHGRWPSGTDYVSAVQHLDTAFCDPELRRGSTRPGWLGLPAFASGQNAVVFPIDLPGGNVAVKCFTGGTAEQRRYEALAEHLKRYPCHVLADATWSDEGIEVLADKWPIVTMPWLSGKGLHEFVGSALDNSDRLTRLASDWRTAVRQLGQARIAHGDLQHGNVIIGEGSTIRLVDYDGIWVDEIANLPPGEVGQPNYQHPERIQTGAWGQKIDTFSALVIYLSLLALAAQPDLWPDCNNGENLIFTADDYLSPAKTKVWKRLNASPNPDTVELAQLLQGYCKVTVNLGVDLEAILESRQIPNAKPWAPRKPQLRGQWWDPATDVKPGATQWPTTPPPDQPIMPSPRASGAWTANERLGITLIVLGILTVGISLLAAWVIMAPHGLFPGSVTHGDFFAFRDGLRSAPGHSDGWLVSLPTFAAVALAGVALLGFVRRLGPEVALALGVPLSSLGYFAYEIHLFHLHAGPGPWIALGGIVGTFLGILFASHDRGGRFRHVGMAAGVSRTSGIPGLPSPTAGGQPTASAPSSNPSTSGSSSGPSFAAPPAWYPDPTGRFEQRYWDGGAWTDNVSTGGTRQSDRV